MIVQKIFENKCYQNCPDFTNDDNNDKICEKNIDKYIPTTYILYNEKSSNKIDKSFIEDDTEKIGKTDKNVQNEIKETIDNPYSLICGGRQFLLGKCEINSFEEKYVINNDILK